VCTSSGYSPAALLSHEGQAVGGVGAIAVRRDAKGITLDRVAGECQPVGAWGLPGAEVELVVVGKPPPAGPGHRAQASPEDVVSQAVAQHKVALERAVAKGQSYLAAGRLIADQVVTQVNAGRGGLRWGLAAQKDRCKE